MWTFLAISLGAALVFGGGVFSAGVVLYRCGCHSLIYEDQVAFVDIVQTHQLQSQIHIATAAKATHRTRSFETWGLAS